MRTVSFSDNKVRSLLNRQFVNTYTNTHGDPTAGKSIKHRPNESPGPCLRGNGKQNVQTIFMTPDGEIFHVATGYQSSEDLLEESKFAINLFKGIQNCNPNERSSLVGEAHQNRLNSTRSNSRSPLSEFDNVFAKLMPNANVQGSRSRSAMPGFNMMGNFTQMGVDADQQFSIRYPMLSYKQLERDPAKLVGNGSSFFASSGMGTNLFSK